MRDFGGPTFRLGQASYETRLVYTGFLVLVCIGLLTMGGMEALRIGVRPSAISAHYRGGELGKEMAFPKTVGTLMEVAHFHAFIMGVIFLVLAHLFLATGWSVRAKRWWVAAALASTLADLLTPWLVRFVAGGFAVLVATAWAGLWVSYAVMIGGALREMWGG